MTTDETAKAILDGIQTQHSRWISPTSGAVAVEIPAEHLQAMVRLWLMREEICSHLDPSDPTRADIERLEEK